MNHVSEAEKLLCRPVGRLLGVIEREKGIYEGYVLPSFAGEDRGMVFIKRPTRLDRFLRFFGMTREPRFWPPSEIGQTEAEVHSCKAITSRDSGAKGTVDDSQDGNPFSS